MKLSASIFARLSALKLPAHAYQEVLAIIGDVMSEDEARREKHRLWKRGYRSADSPLLVHGQSNGKCVDSPTDKKEIPPTPPKEKTIPQEAKASFGSHPGRARVGYSAEFEKQFWQPYPRTPVMSKAEAWKAWQKLSEEDQAKAIKAVPLYVSWLRSKPDHPAVHACRFLTQRRFDGFEPTALERATVAGFYAPATSPQLQAWDDYGQRTKGKTYPRDKAGGWRFPTEWPPEHERMQAAE